MVVGRMIETAKLAGVYGMQLEAGQLIRVVEATNIPQPHGKRQWFATPLDGAWSDGVERDSRDSILLDSDDFRFVTHRNPIRSRVIRRFHFRT